MAAKGDDRIKSATFFTTLVDFTEPGELGVFIDEEQLAALEKNMAKRGYLEGAEMATTLQHAARQRPDLVVRGQQLPAGQGPVPVRPAVLELRHHPHAGGDAQLLPAQHVPRRTCWCSRAASASAACRSTSRKIDTAGLLAVSTKEDHIAPWKSDLRRRPSSISGPKQFVLAGSGHIAGVVNPPAAGKYGYWTQRRAAGRPGSLVRGRPAS